PFAPVDRFEDLQAAVQGLGLPAVLKTRRLGYDGKGQFLLRHEDDVRAAWRSLGGVPLVLAAHYAFDRELSQLAVRGPDSSVARYPPGDTHPAAGVLRLSLAPAPTLTADLQERAAAAIRRVMQELDYVGVLAIEFFQKGDELIANEMAPRVHNSGHWTIEGA